MFGTDWFENSLRIQLKDTNGYLELVKKNLQYTNKKGEIPIHLFGGNIFISIDHDKFHLFEDFLSEEVPIILCMW